MVLRFACISWTLLWLVSTQSTFLKFSGCSRFSEFESNETATYIKHWAYTSSHRVLGRFLNRSGLHLRGVITRIKPASKQAIQVLIQICFAIVIYQWKFISIHYFEEGFILRGQWGRELIIRCTFLSTCGWAYNRAEGGGADKQQVIVGQIYS